MPVSRLHIATRYLGVRRSYFAICDLRFAIASPSGARSHMSGLNFSENARAAAEFGTALVLMHLIRACNVLR
jgi:hypothetical protein